MRSTAMPPKVHRATPWCLEHPRSVLGTPAIRRLDWDLPPWTFYRGTKGPSPPGPPASALSRLGPGSFYLAHGPADITSKLQFGASAPMANPHITGVPPASSTPIPIGAHGPGRDSRLSHLNGQPLGVPREFLDRPVTLDPRAGRPAEVQGIRSNFAPPD
jgi:hypothetical protein